MLVPDYVQNYFLVDKVRRYADGYTISGHVFCCSKHFKMLVNSKVSYSILGNINFDYSQNGVALNAFCPFCGKTIRLFNSEYDGYDGKEQQFPVSKLENDGKHICNKEIRCKCGSEQFSIRIKYEYANTEDMPQDDVHNCFTWIWISVYCSKCGRKYRNIIDFETA